jgi:anti-sigma factor RsiW
MSDEADRLITAALHDHARIPAPPRLHAKLARRYLAPRRPWLVASVSAFGGAIAAAAIVLLLVHSPRPAIDPANEAVGDHLRMLIGRGLGVEVSDMHQVKPWFAGKLDFVPPITFLGDDDFPLAGGDVAVFLGHKAAQLVYHRRLHVISLFVFQGDVPDGDHTVQGFHVVMWTRDGFGFALVSDVNFDELHTLHAKLQ